MFGISYGEVFLLLGATAALIGPKDLPIIARTAGRLAGRAIGYVQMARGQFESVMQQSQARQVHRELQDTMAQLEAIRHEIRSISFMNPGPLTTRLVDNVASRTSSGNVDEETSKPPEENSARVKNAATATTLKDHSSPSLDLSDIHRQATAYTRLAESTSLDAKSTDEVLHELIDESGQFIVLPVSAESAGLLPNRKDDLKGSDILLAAVLEADVAHNAKDFFSQPQNQKD
ncbi:uncharacterized protein LOC111411838 [Olea europaea var. sylvestris]|uniref:Sec-independent protein translocase protein TatB n=2 Tax=Olea europaea subsp. europaea TaxID=158383 RepID=A0A8S0VP06_OLEEU|nr:uncharacterized protein LOC111411838 [Olea europaea var. sylvestris]CAA3032804.1 Hypothetical predicted protein [Olea europaea subsp. europaea]